MGASEGFRGSEVHCCEGIKTPLSSERWVWSVCRCAKHLLPRSVPLCFPGKRPSVLVGEGWVFIPHPWEHLLPLGINESLIHMPRKCFHWPEELHRHMHAHVSFCWQTTLLDLTSSLLSLVWPKPEHPLRKSLSHTSSLQSFWTNPGLRLAPSTHDLAFLHLTISSRQITTFWHTTWFLSTISLRPRLCPLFRSACPVLCPRMPGTFAGNWHLWHYSLLLFGLQMVAGQVSVQVTHSPASPKMR